MGIDRMRMTGALLIVFYLLSLLIPSQGRTLFGGFAEESFNTFASTAHDPPARNTLLGGTDIDPVYNCDRQPPEILSNCGCQRTIYPNLTAWERYRRTFTMDLSLLDGLILEKAELTLPTENHDPGRSCHINGDLTISCLDPHADLFPGAVEGD